MKSFVESGLTFSLVEVKPCLADQRRIRIIAQFNTDLTPILEILFLHFYNSSYSRELGCVITKKHGQMTTIFGSGKVAMTYQVDEEEVINNLRNLARLITKAFDYLNRNGQVDSSLVQQRENLNALEILKLLPRTDCGDCGESGCFAFATRLLLGERNIDDCSQLKQAKFSRMRKALKRFIQPIDLDQVQDHNSELAEFLGLKNH